MHEGRRTFYPSPCVFRGVFLILFLMGVTQGRGRRNRVMQVLQGPVVRRQRATIMTVPQGCSGGTSYQRGFGDGVGISIVTRPFIFDYSAILFGYEFATYFILSRGSLSSMFITVWGFHGFAQWLCRGDGLRSVCRVHHTGRVWVVVLRGLAFILANVWVFCLRLFHRAVMRVPIGGSGVGVWVGSIGGTKRDVGWGGVRGGC